MPHLRMWRRTCSTSGEEAEQVQESVVPVLPQSDLLLTVDLFACMPFHRHSNMGRLAHIDGDL